MPGRGSFADAATTVCPSSMFPWLIIRVPFDLLGPLVSLSQRMHRMRQGGESQTIPSVSPKDPHISTRHLTCLIMSQPPVWFASAKALDDSRWHLPIVGQFCPGQIGKEKYATCSGHVLFRRLAISRKQQLFAQDHTTPLASQLVAHHACGDTRTLVGSAFGCCSRVTHTIFDAQSTA